MADVRNDTQGTEPKLSLQSCTSNSDTASRSPWTRKILLSLGISQRDSAVGPCLHFTDGGGIRGYSSLLILQRLLDIVQILETGNHVVLPDGLRSTPGRCKNIVCPSHELDLE